MINKFLIILGLLCLPHAAFAAIAFDAAQQTVPAGASDTFTMAAASGNNTILFVQLDVRNAHVDVVTALTAGGTAMTLVTKMSDPNGYKYLYSLTGVGGALTITCTGCPAGNTVFDESSYTGVKQTGQPEAQITNTATAATSITTSVTTITDNAWMLTAVGNDNATPTRTAGANTTQRAGGQDDAIGDTNSAQTPAGLKSMTWNGGSQAWSVIQVAFAPAASSSPPPPPPLVNVIFSLSAPIREIFTL